MELITPSFEIWEQDAGLDNMWKHIARCTRVCYQSTPKNDGETDEEFVKRVILRPDSSTGNLNFDKIHGAMLEHGTIYLHKVVDSYIEIGEQFYGKYKNNKYSKVVHKNTHFEKGGQSFNAYITTNLRVLYENNWLDDLKYICAPTKDHVKRVTVSFTTNIGVTREFNRHRVDSISEESTRYCNYTKEKFGSNIKIGLPAWFLEEDDTDQSLNRDMSKQTIKQWCEDILDFDGDLDSIATVWDAWGFYFFGLKAAEFAYNGLIKSGWKPQQAREVLPLATKTQLIHTAFVDDWEHFFDLRALGVSGAPHPNAKLLAEPLCDAFIKRNF